MADRRLVRQCLRSPAMWPAAAFFLLQKRLGRATIRVRRQGQVLHIGAGNGQGAWQAISGLEYEPELRQLLARIRPGDVIIDIGANVGSYTLRCARRTGPGGRVIAIEAMAANAALLERNIAANGLKNVRVVACAIGDKPGRVALYSKGHSSSTRLSEGDSFSAVAEAEMITGDSLIEIHGLTRVDWIKMDIEGAEPAALRGLPRILAEFRPSFLFENNSGAVEMTRLLREARYKMGSFNKRGELVEATGHPINLFGIPGEKLDNNHLFRNGDALT
jgi:FkbM family methyltransferase